MTHNTISALRSSFLIIVFVLSAFIFSLLPLAVHAAGEIEITTWEQLAGISSDLDGDYILMNDLGPLDVGYDLYADGAANMGSGWVPLGPSGDPFTGNFDGQGFTITGLTLNRAGGYNGFFGSTSDATISDLTLSNVSITETSSESYAGGLIGHALNTTVEDVSVDGSINAQSNYVGGLVGYLEDYDPEVISHITNANTDVVIEATGGFTGGLIGEVTGTAIVIHDVYAEGNIETTGAFAGGLIGRAYYPKIYNAYATGSVIGTGGGNSYRIGGFIGEVEKAHIFDSYATGDVSGDSGIGGFIGDNWYGIIANVFAKGSVTGTGVDIGALIGESDVAEDYSLTGSFWNSEVNGGPAIGDENGFMGIGELTVAQFTEAALFTETGWDFDNVWIMGAEYPELRSGIEYFDGVNLQYKIFKPRMAYKQMVLLEKILGPHYAIIGK